MVPGTICPLRVYIKESIMRYITHAYYAARHGFLACALSLNHRYIVVYHL